MLREMCISFAKHPVLRRAASWAFRVPGVGHGLRQVADSIVPPEERILDSDSHRNRQGLVAEGPSKMGARVSNRLR